MVWLVFLSGLLEWVDFLFFIPFWFYFYILVIYSQVQFLILTFLLKTFGWVAGWLRREHGILKIRLNSVNH